MICWNAIAEGRRFRNRATEEGASGGADIEQVQILVFKQENER